MHTPLGKRLITGALFFVSALFLTAGGQQAPSAAPPGNTEQTADTVQTVFPLTITDDLGTEITLSGRPESIISLSLFSDEILLELLPIERFAAVTGIAVNPIYSNVAETAALVTPVIEFNVEQIISIYPDLVIAANWSEADKIDQLRQAGIPVFQVDTPSSMNELREAILQLGTLTDAQEAAAEMIAAVDSRIEALQRKVAELDSVQRVTAMDYTTWGAAAGDGTTWDVVLELAGIANAAAELEADEMGQVPLSKEVLIEVDPDILFLPGYVWGEDDGAQAFYREVMQDPALQGLQAIQTERVYMFPERLKGTYSQYLVDAAELAAEIAYPEIFQP
ncbi:MAG: ABC transporter substrate-binding protein [Spirochaeta sp.]